MTNNGKDQTTPPKTSEQTAAILAEAQRRMNDKQQQTAKPSEQEESQKKWAIKVNRGVYWLSKHWISVFNFLTALYLLGAIMAPVFVLWSMPRISNRLYAFYDPFCHQLPFRSFFVGGERWVYPLEGDPGSVAHTLEMAHDIGDATRGYKMALCERDIAIYAVMLLAGIAYGIARRALNRPLNPLPLWILFVFFIMPMFLDGGLQWLSYTVSDISKALVPVPFETVPAMRVLTGGLFGFGMTWILYPYVDEFFIDIQKTQEEKFGW